MAFSSYVEAAKLGDVMAQLAAGNAYASGRGVEKDLKEAARWYKRAYHSGSSVGALNLSVDMHKQGNLRGAKAWLGRAAAFHDGEAYLQLARLYLQKRRALKAVIPLLKDAAAFGPAYISDESREEAVALLKSIGVSSSDHPL